MIKQKLLIISNLYPLPWEPNRATFNKQQFELLKDDYDVLIAVPIAWPEYIKHRKLIKKERVEIDVFNYNMLKIVEDQPVVKVVYFPFFYTPKIGRRFYPKMMELSFKLFTGSLLNKFIPDKIFASWAFPDGVVGQRLAGKMNVPFYLKVHGSDINGHGDIESRAKQVVHAANNANGVLSVSNALREKMINMGVEPNKIRVIYNGVNKEKFLPGDLSCERNNILYVGNLKDNKGVMELLEAFHLLGNEHPELTLSYAGSGHMQSELKNYVESNNLSEKVAFLGVVDHHNLPTLMQKAKFVALPSYAEGVPNVILESMSCGTPVVATTVGGIPEVVIEGVTGCLSEPRSSRSFYEALKKAIECKWDRAKIVEHAKLFDWNHNKGQLLNLLKR